MLRFATRRAAQAVPLLLVVSLLVFALIHAAPGGPLALYLDNPNVRPQDIERLRRAMGLDRPLAEQYLAWLWAFVRGDWGYSYADGRPVLNRLLERVPATLELVGTSTIAAVAVALLVGMLAAVRRGFDRVATIAAVAGISLPVFWFGLVLQLVFANALGWLPSSGRASFAGGGHRPTACAPRAPGRGARRRARRRAGRATCAARCARRWRCRSSAPRARAA